GRALWLGEIDTPSGVQELQLKGAGQTPYSRTGDGRAVLRSSIREFLCSEAMHGLGIPTTRALCVTGSALPVLREQLETAAVVTRVAPSFIRFGHFEHFAQADGPEALKRLVDFVIDHHYPECRHAPVPAVALLKVVAMRTAEVMAQWQAVGFCHGVMNTDNMSILGITLDYGPFGFMEAFDAHHICNHTDSQGRYAYNVQPQVGHWNCYALGQAMLPLIGEVDDVHEALATYQTEYTAAFDAAMHAKLGLATREEQDGKLFDELFAVMQKSRADFTLFFRRLGDLRIDDPAGDAPIRDLFIDRAAFDAWALQYRSRLRREASQDDQRHEQMHRVNPKYVLRNYLAQVAIEKAQDRDFS
ncbi:MAG: YdiU family protein, partial [Lacisediminimonas sp.]|nr:YdiU family protein [Lacisediminimonas sp.]